MMKMAKRFLRMCSGKLSSYQTMTIVTMKESHSKFMVERPAWKSFPAIPLLRNSRWDLSIRAAALSGTHK